VASIYRRTTKRLLPEKAEIITRRRRRRGRPADGKAATKTLKVAQWTDGRGRKHEAELAPDGRHVLIEVPTWYARYRDADGVEQRRSTGCRDEQAARQTLAGWLAEADKIRSGALTREEADTARHSGTRLAEHFTDYLDFLKAKTVRGRKVSAAHRYNVEKQLARVAKECGFPRIGDIIRAKMVRWMNSQAEQDTMAARTVNTHRAALVAFCRWAVRENRLQRNPLAGLPKADESEKARERRALSADELASLLEAARTRPLRDALTIRRGKRKGELAAKVSDSERERLIRLGRQRVLIYRTMVYTGLRKGELASLTVDALHLEAENPHIALAAKNAKSGRGASLPLRSDLADALGNHLADMLDLYRRRTLADGRHEIPQALPGTMTLFDRMPTIRTFDLDLGAAGIAKTDAEGRTVDVHCLRHTFATMLSQAGVAPRRAQELMRHSDIRLTMSTYTHLELADTAGAVEALPEIVPAAALSVRTGTGDCSEPDGMCAEPCAVPQEICDVSSPSQATYRDRAWSSRHKKTPAKTASCRGFREAGEGSRTLNNQLGRLEL